MSQLDNPYAPPASVEPRTTPKARRSGGASDYSREARSVVLVVFLALVTLGVYPSVWYVRRQAFVDSLDADRKLGPGLPWSLVALTILNLVIAVASPEISNVFAIGSGILSLIARFRIARILRSDFARSGRRIDVQSLLTFFLGVAYLQYKINQASEIRAHVRKKKRKPKPAPEAALTSTSP